MRDVSLRVEVSESPLLGVSCVPRFSRHFKCLSNKVILSGVQNFVIAIGKPTLRCRHFGKGEEIGTFTEASWRLFPSRWGKVTAGAVGHSLPSEPLRGFCSRPRGAPRAFKPCEAPLVSLSSPRVELSQYHLRGGHVYLSCSS